MLVSMSVLRVSTGISILPKNLTRIWIWIPGTVPIWLHLSVPVGPCRKWIFFWFFFWGSICSNKFESSLDCSWSYMTLGKPSSYYFLCKEEIVIVPAYKCRGGLRETWIAGSPLQSQHWRLRRKIYHEFQASMSHRVSSRPAWVIE